METTSFFALVVDQNDGNFEINMQTIGVEDLQKGEVLIKVQFSSLNYKDALACIPNGKVVQSYPHIPGVDLSGTVISSQDPRFQKGQRILVTGFGLGVSHFGGFSQFARVPAEWIVPLPESLELDEAMIIGTAGFTAALSIERLEHNGLHPQNGPVLVTGSTGGVGSFAVAMLATKGYQVVASTGKEEEHDFLYSLGASEIIHRDEVNPNQIRPLSKQRWAGAIDPVGGRSLAFILSSMQYGGSVAVSGLTGGGEFSATVHPFILRNINLLGIDSVNYPIELRKTLWERIGVDMKQTNLIRRIGYRIQLREVPNYIPKILSGQIRGRVIIEL